MSEHFLYPIKISVNHWNECNKKSRKSQNKVISTRYTWYSFLPLVVFQQLQIISNFYYLVNICINNIIDSPIDSGVDVFPLTMLIFIGLIIIAVEESKLHISDNEINQQNTLVLRDDKFVECKFQSLCPGDVIKCVNNDPFPADILILFSNRESNDCSVTTVDLDGESNLKTFHGTMDPVSDDSISDEVKLKKLEIQCINSSEDLYKFQGTLSENEDSEKMSVLSGKNLLLRGSRLKNTEFIVGCVVYAGQNTKLSLNSKRKNKKFSTVDSALNFILIIYFILQTVMALACCLTSNLLYFKEDWLRLNWYVPSTRIGLWKQVEIFLAFFIIFNRLLPIGLFTSMYMVRGLASSFLNMDLSVYDSKIDQRAKINTIGLIEEMGHIDYLFSDKTGTLTENLMTFHCCSTVDGIYRNINDELYQEEADRLLKVENSFSDNLKDLFICLCLCHTVKVSREDGSLNFNFSNDVNVSELSYQACSPDEEAFLCALKNYGFIYLGGHKHLHYIMICGKVHQYKLVDILEFDSTRKCMSVIVDFPDGSSQLICKGAESTLFQLVANTAQITEYMETLQNFSQQGLRVLVIAKKSLTKDEIENFCKNLKNYRSTPSLIDRESELYPSMENKLTIVGVTGVEDKLQEDVPETIQDLREAGIKIWVITGDKEETALNISLSARHIDQTMFLHRLTNIESEEDASMQLILLLEKLTQSDKVSHALIVNGQSFSFLVGKLLVTDFIKVCSHMKVTLCCRMTPLQKSQIVKVVKENVKPTPITAAIGDGGNDIAMILEAHVGIGIFGKEGRQASRVADYAIGKFKFLRPVVLVHGQDFFIRLNTYINLYFVPSILFVHPLFLFSFFNVFSTLHFYSKVATTMFGFNFTTILTVNYIILSKTISAEKYLAHPTLYERNRKSRELDVSRTIISAFIAVLQSSVVFMIIYLIYSNDLGFVGFKGHTYDHLFFGQLIYYSIWGIYLIKVNLLLTKLSYLAIIVLLCNILIGFLSDSIYQCLFMDEEFFLIVHVLSEPFSWLLIFISIIIGSWPDIFIRLHKNSKMINL